MMESRRLAAEILILQERERQKRSEGFDVRDDDTYVGGELYRAGWCYLMHHTGDLTMNTTTGVPVSFPWHRRWWKPRNRRDDTLRAGALFLAEKERCERAGISTQDADYRLNGAIMSLAEALPQIPPPAFEATGWRALALQLEAELIKHNNPPEDGVPGDILALGLQAAGALHQAAEGGQTHDLGKIISIGREAIEQTPEFERFKKFDPGPLTYIARMWNGEVKRLREANEVQIVARLEVDTSDLRGFLDTARAHMNEIAASVDAALEWHDANQEAIAQIGPGTTPQWVIDARAAVEAFGAFVVQASTPSADRREGGSS